MHSPWGQGSLQASEDPRQTMMRVKTRIPEESKRGVVYEVPCHLHWGDQEDAQGETRRAQAGSEAWRLKERHRSPCP